MATKLHRLRNVPASSAFRLNLKGKGILEFQNERLSCHFEFVWNCAHGETLRCVVVSDRVSPNIAFGTKAKFEGGIQEGQWARWLVSAPVLSFSGCSGAKPNWTFTFVTPPRSAIIVERTGNEKFPDTLCYWIPNFFFEASIETSRFRNRRCADGFVFSACGFDFTFRQVANYKRSNKKLESREAFGAITTIVEQRGQLPVSFAIQNSDVVNCLFSLMSGMEGAWCFPVARAEYSKRDLLRIVFPCGRTMPYWPHQGAIWNWQPFLEKALPNFVALADPLKLRSVCRQMVEAQSNLTTQSSVAIHLMSLEQISARYLDHVGQTIRGDAPLEQKLNRSNKTLQCLSKAFRRSLPEIREELRNPLFHEGACDEADFERLCGHQSQLMNAVALMLSAICGYDGSIHLFSYDKGMKVTTVKAAGAE